MPVDRDVVLIQPPEVVGRKVNADSNALLSECRDHWPHDIFAVGRMGHAEFRRTGVPHTESGVVLRCKHHVSESGQLGQARVIIRPILIGIEVFRQSLEEALT